MRPATSEWVEKAEGDFASANRELHARKAPNFDSACFHAQQCAEKYLKAVLQEKDVRFGHTHHLEPLVSQIIRFDGSFELIRQESKSLSAAAARFRYPGHTATKELAREAVAQCSRIRDAARRFLGLPSDLPIKKRKRK